MVSFEPSTQLCEIHLIGKRVSDSECRAATAVSRSARATYS